MTVKNKPGLGYAVVVGPYRYHNFGDDLIGAIIAKYLQSNSYDVCIPQLSKENATWLEIEHSPNYDAPLRNCDLMVIGGGGLLADAGIYPHDFYRELALNAAIVGHARQIRVITTGIGAGPLSLHRSRLLSQHIAKLSERVGIRDIESKEFLESLGVEKNKLIQGADLALLSSHYLDINRQSSEKIAIQFDILNYSDILSENIKVGRIMSEIANYVDRNSSTVVLVSNGIGKSQLYNRLKSKCDSLCYQNLEVFLPQLSGVKAIFTSHLHLAIYAYSQRIPCFSLYVREKTKRFYDQIGHPERASDLRIASPETFIKLISQAQISTWSSDDERRLKELQGEAQLLLNILNP